LTTRAGRLALLGGSPTRLLRLAPAAARHLDSAELTVADATSAALAARLLDAGVAHPVPRLPGPNPSQVSVVVPVRDRVQPLRRLLAALAATAPGLAEVLVVDDGSVPPLRPDAENARVLRHVVSRGPSAARNTGLAAARTELVAFLDSDVVPTPGWLATLLPHFADPNLALAAPRIVGLPSRRPTALERYEGLRSSLDLGPRPAPVLPRSRVAYVPSATLLVRRAALGAGFAPELRVAEDVDLVLRLRRDGWRMRYEPAARVAHEHRARGGQWWRRKAFYGTGAAPLALRHPGAVPPAVLSPTMAAVVALLLAQRRPASVAEAALTASSWVRLRRSLPDVSHPSGLAARLAAAGLFGAASQAAGLLVRHWWPITAVAAVASRRVRRAALAAALADGLLDWLTHLPDQGEPGLDPVRYLLARRLDDLGYGAGLWWGAARARTLAPLLPIIAWPGHSPNGRVRSSGFAARRDRGSGVVGES
jgi:mycofactocin system glycosyltransferase